MIPTDKINEKFETICPMTENIREQNRRYEARMKAARDHLNPGQVDSPTYSVFGEEPKVSAEPTTYVIQTYKSGLRKAVESRLSWLGIDNGLSFLNREHCE